MITSTRLYNLRHGLKLFSFDFCLDIIFVQLQSVFFFRNLKCHPNFRGIRQTYSQCQNNSKSFHRCIYLACGKKNVVNRFKYFNLTPVAIYAMLEIKLFVHAKVDLTWLGFKHFSIGFIWHGNVQETKKKKKKKTEFFFHEYLGSISIDLKDSWNDDLSIFNLIACTQ